MEAILTIINTTKLVEKNSGLYGIWTHNLCSSTLSTIS